ncbi:MAG: hypothetical protein JRN09_05075 [Nitrososphaerota archaeon]|nr:hypothetical protein [Nitrososphaerota archaeon]
MATSIRFALSRGTPGKILAFAYANAGLLGLTLSVVTAGVLAFYVVTVPPGTVAYP